MSTLKLKLGERRVRHTVAKVEIEEDGKSVIGELPVEYYSLTIAEIRKMDARQKAAATDPDQTVWLSDVLVQQVHALPSIVDSKGKSMKITLENLEQLELPVLLAIQAAIREDTAPKQQPGS